MAYRTFKTQVSYGTNTVAGQSIQGSETIFSGYSTCGDRPHKPKPLGVTAMTIQRSYANGSFGYRFVGPTGQVKTGSAQWCYLGQPYTTRRTDTRGEANALANRAMAKFASGDVNLMVFGAELGKTTKTVLQAISLATNTVTALRQKDVSKLKDLYGPLPVDVSNYIRGKHGKQLADAYLAYSFGLKPAYADAHASVEAFRTGITGGLEIGSKVSAAAGSPRPKQSTQMAGRATGDTRPPDLGPLARRAVVRGLVKDPQARTLAQLGLANPLAAAWELTPFSFLIDWFLPIGDTLQGLTANVGVSNTSACTITERRLETHVNNGPWISTGQLIVRSGFDNWYALPTPASLHQAVGHSADKIAAAAALLRQRAFR